MIAEVEAWAERTASSIDYPSRARLLYRCYPVAIVRSYQHRAAREIEFEIGSGVGIRTLNLAVNRSLRPVQK
jgi:hypothetical protein